MTRRRAATTRPRRIAAAAPLGAGPIGLELAVALKRAGVDYLHFDARQIGYSMTWWPRETEFFSTSERLAIAGVPIQTTPPQAIPNSVSPGRTR